MGLVDVRRSRARGLGLAVALWLFSASPTVSPLAPRWEIVGAVALHAPRVMMEVYVWGSKVVRHAGAGGRRWVGDHVDARRVGGVGGRVVLHSDLGLEYVHHVMEVLGELGYFLVQRAHL